MRGRFIPDRSGFLKAAIRDGKMIRAAKVEARRLARLDEIDAGADGQRPPRLPTRRGARSFGFPLK